MNFSNRQSLGLQLGRWGVVGMAASMPISRAIFNVCSLLMLVGWLLSGDFRQKFEALKRDVVAWACVALFLVIAVSATYSSAGQSAALAQVMVYSKLLYIPLILTLITDPLWNRRAWFALVGGLSVTLTTFVLDIWFDIPGTRTFGESTTMDKGVFYHHIAQGMALAFLAAYALHKALRPGLVSQRVLWLLVMAIDVAAMVFVNESRAGQLSVLAALFLVVLTHTPIRWRWTGLALAALVIAGIGFGSSNMQERFKVAWNEASTYQANGQSTSVGARLKAWEAAGEQIRQEPLLGHGAGAYRPLAYQHFSGSPICSLGVCEQPHNQFILTTFEAGLAGLIALLAFLVSPLLVTKEPQSKAALLYLPLLGIFFATAFFDSSLMIRPQAYFFITTMGLLMASRQAERPAQPPQMAWWLRK